MNLVENRWQRPSELPPWLAALIAVGAILLTINLLPSLASAITPNAVGGAAPFDAGAPVEDAAPDAGTPDGGRSPSSDTDSTPRTSADCDRAKSSSRPTRTPAPTPTQQRSLREDLKDLARTYGVAPPSPADRHAAVRAALIAAKNPCTDPLPRSGTTLGGAMLAAVLLAAGLALLVMIGFKTDRPWPGRYVRRFR
jgi:hypothetical protein